MIKDYVTLETVPVGRVGYYFWISPFIALQLSQSKHYPGIPPGPKLEMSSSKEKSDRKRKDPESL